MLDNEFWEITNERKDASPLLGFLPLFRSMTTDITEYFGLDLKVEFLVEFSYRHVRMAAFMPHWERLGDETVQVLQQESFINWLSEGLTKRGKDLYDSGNLLRALDVKALSKLELGEVFTTVVVDLERFVRYNQFVNTADFYHNKLTDHLMTILDNHLLGASAASKNHVYSILTTPAKLVWIQQEHQSALEILRLIQEPLESGLSKDECANLFRPKFDAHANTYFWIQYEQEGQALTSKHFEDAVFRMLKDGINAEAKLSQLREKRKARADEYKKVWRTINLRNENRQVFLAARELVFWKLHLREMKVRYYCCADALLREIADRLCLSVVQARHLTEKEVVYWLGVDEPPNHSELDLRIKHSVYHFSQGSVSVSHSDDAKKQFSVVTQTDAPDTLTEVMGNCGQPGKATGRVRQVLTVADMLEFKPGEVLVAYMTDVGVIPAMRAAAAIVTDVGGVTCHAAIVARELGIPCVIGTRIGTEVLKNGYLVDVDADVATVRVVEKDFTVAPSYKGRPSVASESFSIKHLETLRDRVPSEARIQTLLELGNHRSNSIGGKAQSLCRLAQSGFRVPAAFVLPSELFLMFLQSSELVDPILELLYQVSDASSLEANSREVQSLILLSEMPSPLELEITDHYEMLGSPLVAVRSSAPMEDSCQASWAGQLSTFLNTPKHQLIQNIKRCWASRYSAHALIYGLDFDNQDNAFSTAVIVQKMIDSRLSGTVFSIHPTKRNGALIIESCVGLGETLVSGHDTPVLYEIDRSSASVVAITGQGEQKFALRAANSTAGNEKIPVSDIHDMRRILTDAEIQSLTNIVMKIEREYGFPVDVEWAIEGNNLYIVQSRPITA